MVDGVDFVQCKLCNFHAAGLGKHIVSVHNVSIVEYESKYGKCISKNSSERRSAVNIENGAWIARAQSEGKDLSEYFKKNGEAASKSILNNPKEIKRRSETMKKVIDKLVLDPKYIKKLSDRAKITSARPEIQKKRSEVLKKWREEHPEEFEKAYRKMITTYQTKPEKVLFEFIKKIKGYEFKKNQFINSINISNKSGNKQVDIADKKKRIYVEYDGPLHFLPKFGQEKLDLVQKKDNELDNHILNHNWILIRISYDQFISKQNIKNCKFKFSALKQLVKIIKQNNPGVYRIGKLYGKH